MKANHTGRLLGSVTVTSEPELNCKTQSHMFSVTVTFSGDDEFDGSAGPTGQVPHREPVPVAVGAATERDTAERNADGHQFNATQEPPM